MITTEREMFNQIETLKSKYKLHGIKAEFEAEGTSFRDLMRLCRVVARADLGVFLKIGGVEAKTDIKNALELDVKGLIAPMVESKFGLKKFLEITEEVYQDQPVNRAINIETKGGVDNLEEILDLAKGKIDHVTVGRSDLSKSYFDPEVTPDSPFIMDVLYKVGKACKERGIAFTVGGSVSTSTISALKDYPEVREMIDYLETRKVILPTESWFINDHVIDDVFKFERLYIESVANLYTRLFAGDMVRLDKLKERA